MTPSLQHPKKEEEEAKPPSSIVACPSLAQTHAQAPLTALAVNGSGKSLTREELNAIKADLEAIKKEFGLKEPKRDFSDLPRTKWRFGGPPD